jgi:hypothetical protein
VDNIFGQPKKVDSVSKFADLFGIEPGKSGDRNYVQQVKSTVSMYRTQELLGNQPVDSRNLLEIPYKVVGYDEELKKHRVVQGLECKRENVGTIVSADIVLKSSLAKEKRPNKIVDEYGNIFEKI